MRKDIKVEPGSGSILSILLLALSWGLCFVLSIPPSGRTGNFACRIPAAGEMHRHAAGGSPKLWCFVVHSRGIGLLCACASGSSSESSNRTRPKVEPAIELNTSAPIRLRTNYNLSEEQQYFGYSAFPNERHVHL